MGLLYKYRPLNANTLKLILTNGYYFADPMKDFNDPFDCTMLPKDIPSMIDYISTRRAEFSLERPELGKMFSPEETFDERKLKIKSDMETGDVTGNIAAFRQAFVSHGGIFCLSELSDNILMFSHYADQHKGVCLGFDIDSLLELAQPGSEYTLVNVRYTDTIDDFAISELTELHELTEFFLHTKATHWSYEQERRFMCLPGSGIKYLPKKLLRVIICGCEMSTDNVQLLREVIKIRDPPVELLQANKVPAAFALTIDPV